ncbi:hypothetical protein HNQ94_001002 [Salirhabdus euzebyi]|uniref:Uncharacterized protein n=1 Tax=Salirhabdus euzebyi TaxID=394506 RepID=A0A841PU88_9BACI|nr:hypothetical protein [Salirhabdus euzebyi]MBB6452557.1 hypothetical protein [Salirhabdus euzebyi]
MDYQNMTLKDLQKDLIVEARKGFPFFLAGTVYWLVMGILYFFIGDQQVLALCYLLGTGSIFPLALLLGNLFKLNLLSKNPLGVLGGIVGGIQAFYLPIWIVIYLENYELLPMVIGVLGASHFLPYLWIYRSKTYGIFTVGMAVVSFFLGYVIEGHAFLTLPFILSALYLVTACALIKESKAFITEKENVTM